MRKFYSLFFTFLFVCFATAINAQSLIISEFRLRGPNGPNDEFVEIYNNSDADITIASAGPSTGYALAASNGVTRFVIPNGTVIPARGHYLGVNSVGYSLASYPAGNGTTATGDATYTTDIPDNAGIALFNTTVAANFTLSNRLDAVGSTTEANTLYKEGPGYPALTPYSIDYSFHRRQINGRPQETNNNAADFKFEDTNGTSAGAGQSLGAPGPENLSSPLNSGTGLVVTYIDRNVPSSFPPNFVRDLTSSPANNSTFGTVDLRLKITNNTGGVITRLRLRVVDLTTFPSPSGVSDLRPRTSTAVVVVTSYGNKTVQGTTLEQLPSQPNGGGINSSMSVGVITLATPLPNSDSAFVRILLGVQQTGSLNAKFLLEALPNGGAGTAGSGTGASTPFSYFGSDGAATFNGHLVPPINTGDLVISEFRVRGPNGDNDEFVEIYNTTDNPITVSALDGSAGYALAASNGVARFVIPNGTVIPAHGHYLGVNSVGYSLASYPSGNGTTATGNSTYTTDIPDNAGIALFKTSNSANFTLANRLDAVGSTSESNTLYKEGTGYPELTPFSIDYTFYRKTSTGTVQDSDNNASDYKFEDTNGTSAGAGQSLGAPGPQNLSSPIAKGNAILVTRANPNVAENAAPNWVRDFTSSPANNSTFGTMALRYKITNVGSAPVTRLRFRIDSINTFPSASGIADLRPRTSSSVVITAASGNVTAVGVSLEQPPSQPNGGGFNSSWGVGSVSLATPIGIGDSIWVNLLMGIQQTGSFTVTFTPEALPQGGITGAPIASRGISVDGGPGAPCILTCPANITVSNDAGQCGAVVNYPAITTSGTCGTVTSLPASGSFFPVGTTTVTATSTTGETCTFTITVNDTQLPSVTCPANMTVPNDASSCGAVVTFAAPTVTDNCAGVSVVSVPASGSIFPLGATTVTSTATDAAGNTSTCTFTVTVNDTQPPSVTCPANITVPNDAATCGAVVTFAAPTTSDNCPGVSVVSVPASGSIFPVGTTTVTSTATDAAGNTSTCTFTVTVTDTQLPSITCPANITMGNDPNICGRVVTFTPTVSDNCAGVTVASVPASGSTFPIGTTTVTSTATDAAGNTATCTFTVTINDTQNPTVTCPANVVVGNTPGQCGATVNFTAPTVADNCPGATVVTSPASGSFFPIGTTTVTATATDAVGNTSTCTFTVRVNDTQVPVISCPSNISVTTVVGQCTRAVTFTVTATDNCPGVTVMSNPASGSLFNIGTTTVTNTATDASGLVSTCSFTVTVIDGQLPVVTAPPANRSVCENSNTTFTVVATNAVSYQWQVNTGSGFSDISGATAATLALNNVSNSMNGNQYRVRVVGLCSSVTSASATLTVNPNPTITLAASPRTTLMPGQLTNLNATFNHTPGSFSWQLNGVQQSTVGTGILPNIDVDGIGTWRVVYTDNNGCVGISNQVVISADPNWQLFVYPNPNNGRFVVRFYAFELNVQRNVNVYGPNGNLVFQRQFMMTTPYQRMDVDLTKYASGIYTVELRDKNNLVLGTEKVAYIH